MQYDNNVLLMTLSKFNLTWTMLFQPISSKIVNASVSKWYEISVQMSSFKWCCWFHHMSSQNEATAEDVISHILALRRYFEPQFDLKSQYEHPNIIIFSIPILTCIHIYIYSAWIWRGKNVANILLFVLL